MIKPVVDQFDRENFLVEQFAQNRKGSNLRSLPVPAEPAVWIAKKISGSFKIHPFIQCNDLVTVLTKPALEIGLFPLPFRIAETAGNSSLSHDHSRIGGKHQIREPWRRLHSFQYDSDLFLEDFHQSMPLPDGLLRIDNIRPTHPGIDFVVDAEIIRRTDQQPAHPLHPNSLATSRRNDAASMTNPTA